jgi:glycosyltransferase involved in cell wall biosynthesis
VKLAYLNLQAAVEGQASYAHVREIVHGLEDLGFEIDLFEPRSGTPRTALARVAAILSLQPRLIGKLGRYEAVYVRAHHLAWPTVVAARVLGRPVVLEVNGFYDDLYAAWPRAARLRGVFDTMLRGCMRASSAIIAVTPAIAQWAHRESGGVGTHVIANGADVESLRPGLPAYVGAPEGAYALFFGALAAWQGIEVVVAARSDERWPDGVELVVAGDGEKAPFVRNAEANGLLIYLGVVSHAEIGRLIGNALCSLVPMSDPHRSCSPVKLYESLACGVPVVVSDIPGVSDIVEGCLCAEIVVPGDSGGVADAVSRLALDPDRARAMGVAARKLAVEKHSWRRRARATAEIICGVLSRVGES